MSIKYGITQKMFLSPRWELNQRPSDPIYTLVNVLSGELPIEELLKKYNVGSDVDELQVDEESEPSSSEGEWVLLVVNVAENKCILGGVSIYKRSHPLFV